nr:MAG: hypothetical protein J07AB56_14130 [Candidatus Nanosalinarum sp. J07AB56]
MQPERYIREAEKQLTVRTWAERATYAALLLAGLFLSGGVHEAGHIAVLSGLECRYITSVEALPLRGEVQPLCGMSALEATAFYLSGYTSEVAAGGLLSVLSNRSRWLGWLSLGLIGGLMSNLALAGDLANLASLGTATSTVLAVGFVAAGLGVSVSALRGLEREEGG